MNKNLKLMAIALLLGFVFYATLFIKTPDEILNMLTGVSSKFKILSLFNHLLLITVLILAFLFKKSRNRLFFSFLLWISFTAFLVAILNFILPNIIIFGMFIVFIINASLKNELNFSIGGLGKIDLFFGVSGLIFGFWYLHWVDAPVILNALLFSPLGVVNCPTMLIISGFLCLTGKPRSAVLEMVVAIITLFFGFFGMFKLNVYIDFTLVMCSLFLIFRVRNYAYKKNI